MERLITSVNIITVDIIDTLKMLIGITFEIAIKWKDDRLFFENLDTDGANLISTETANKLWLPSDNIVHDNAILGDIVIDNRKNVGVRNLTDAIPASITNSIENSNFYGSQAELFVVQRIKAIYNRTFELSRFPFDVHECDFVLN